MSSPFEIVAGTGTRTQEATSAVLRSWSDGMSAMAGAPDLYARYIDGLRTALAGQRQLVDAMVDAAQVARSLTHSTVRLAENVLDNLDTAAAGAAEVTRLAADQAAAFGRAAG